MSSWKTVGMLAPSSFLLPACVQEMPGSRRIQITKIGPDDLRHHLVFFSTFEELKLPIGGPMESAGVTKLYEPSPTPCLYVAPAVNTGMVGRVPLIPLFLAGNSTPTIPYQYSKHNNSGFPMGSCDTAAQGGRRGSNVHVPEVNTWLSQFGRGKQRPAWVVCQWIRPLGGRRLLCRSGACAGLRLAGAARLIGLIGSKELFWL